MGAKLDSEIGLYFTHRNGPIFRAKTGLSDVQCRDGFVDPLATVRLTVFRNMNNEINSKHINHTCFGFHSVVKSRYLDTAIPRIKHYPVDRY